MPEPADPATGDSLTIPSLTLREGHGGHLVHCPPRVPCMLRPAVWMALETGLT
jgi:hypothetical protein